MKRLFNPVASCLLLAGSCSLAFADPPGHFWSFRVGGAYYETIQDVAVDVSGNIYAIGGFVGTVDFGGGPLVSRDGIAGASDIFLVKYSSNGAHVWSKSFHTGGMGQAVAVDPLGNVGITGRFGGSANFGGPPLTAALSQDVFLAQYTPNGTHRWSMKFGNPAYGQSDYATDVAFSPSGDVVMIGYYGGPIDLGGGPITSELTDGFLAQYDSLGTHEWSRRLGGSANNDYARSVAVDGSGNVVATGQFGETATFGGASLYASGQWAMYVAKYSPAGAHVWSFRAGNNGMWSQSGGRAVAIDNTGAIIIGGTMNETWDFGGGVPIGDGQPDADIVLLKYNSDGVHQWSHVFAGGYDAPNAVTTDAGGNVLLTGYFSNSMDFGGGPLLGTGGADGGADVFVAKFNAAGTHVWSRSSGGSASCCGDDESGSGIATDGDGNVIVGGYFRATADFGGGPIASAGQSDGFMAKYSSGLPTGVGETPGIALMLGAYPNPFNPGTTIHFSLPQRGHVRIDIHNVAGALVTRLVDTVEDAGPNEVRWNGLDARGRSVASAVYFARMEFQGETRTTKLLLMK